jgi:hypothetical protein
MMPSVSSFCWLHVFIIASAPLQDDKAANKPSKRFNAAEPVSIFPSKAVAKAAAVAAATRPDLTAAAKRRAAKIASGARFAKGVKTNKNVSVVKSRRARK